MRRVDLKNDIKPVSELRAELLRDVRTAVQQIDAGKGLTNREAKAELRRRLNR